MNQNIPESILLAGKHMQLMSIIPMPKFPRDEVRTHLSTHKPL